MHSHVSVILVTYNRAHVLPKTLDSILSQSFRDFELIICDDCSTDDTERICEEYAKHDSRIAYVRNSVNVRMPRNLLNGIERSQYELIANFHDGDVYDPELLRKWRHCLLRHPTGAFVFNAYRALDRFGREFRIFRERLPECFSGRRLIEEIYFRRWPFQSPVWGTVMGRRSAYFDVGLFQERFNMYSDVDMWLRLAQNYDVCYIPEPLIDLPSRDLVPRLFSYKLYEEDKLISRMLWEARKRYYKDEPFTFGFEALRHAIFAMAGRCYTTACWLKNRAGATQTST